MVHRIKETLLMSVVVKTQVLGMNFAVDAIDQRVSSNNRFIG